MFSNAYCFPAWPSRKTSSFPVIYGLNIFPSKIFFFSLAAYFRLQLFRTEYVAPSLSLSVPLSRLPHLFRFASLSLSYVRSLLLHSHFSISHHCYKFFSLYSSHSNAIFHLFSPTSAGRGRILLGSAPRHRSNWFDSIHCSNITIGHHVDVDPFHKWWWLQWNEIQRHPLFLPPSAFRLPAFCVCVCPQHT